MPFALAFGSEAVIPVKIGLASLRTQQPETEQAEKKLQLNLDLVEEKRAEVSLCMEAYQQRMMKYYNVKIRLRGFDNGDLVLHKVSTMTQLPNDNKLGSNWEGLYQVSRSP